MKHLLAPIDCNVKNVNFLLEMQLMGFISAKIFDTMDCINCE